jgi:hypothetical protein
MRCSTQAVGGVFGVEYGSFLVSPYTVVLDHSSLLVSMHSAFRRSGRGSCLESILISSPSTSNLGFGVTASRTKWLSQCGQYSSLVVCVSSQALTAITRLADAKVPLFKLLGILPETFPALLARKDLDTV